MEKEFGYKKSILFKKLFRTLVIIIGSILFDIVMAGDNLIQNILVWLIYISGAALFFIDCFPGILQLFKVNYKKIIIENLSIYFASQENDEQLMLERFKIQRVVFKAFLSEEVEIPSSSPVEDIDESIYKLPGRRFIILTEDGEEYIIHLELLDDDFIEEFIKWYQGNKVF